METTYIWDHDRGYVVLTEAGSDCYRFPGFLQLQKQHGDPTHVRVGDEELQLFDPHDFRADYRRAQAHAKRVDEEGLSTRTTAAYWQLNAWAMCRITGLELGLDVPTEAEKTMGLFGWKNMAPAIHEIIRTLPQRLDECVEESEEEHFVCEVLNWALRAWAMERVTDIDPEQDSFLGTIDVSAVHYEVSSSLGRQDELLVSVIDELAYTIRNHHWAENWRNSLVAEFRNPYPWFLDGTLEAVAKKLETVDTMPPDYLWAACAAQKP